MTIPRKTSIFSRRGRAGCNGIGESLTSGIPFAFHKDRGGRQHFRLTYLARRVVSEVALWLDQKRSQFFIRAHHETLSAAMRVGSRSFARRSPSLPRNPMSVLNHEP
jgi:hypothetical protein